MSLEYETKEGAIIISCKTGIAEVVHPTYIYVLCVSLP